MFGSSVLEVAIGMVFIYLLVSLVVTAVNEMLAGLMKSRSKLLWKGIAAMLETAGAAAPGQPWTAQLYAHPLIRSLFPLEAQGQEATLGPKGHGPTYIPAGSFATALLDVTGVTNARLQEWEAKLSAMLAAIPQEAGQVAQVTQALESMITELSTGLAGTPLKQSLDRLAANWTADPDPAKTLAGIAQGINEPGLTWVRSQLAEVLKNPGKEAVMLVSRSVPAVADVEDGAMLLAQLRGLQGQLAGQQIHFGAALQLAKSFAASITGDGARRSLQALPDGDLRKVLTTLLDEAKGDVDTFKASVEAWFNQSMDRVSGWYKKQNAVINFAVGALVVVLLNVDSVAVLKKLSTDQPMRNALIAQAETYAKNPPMGVLASGSGQATEAMQTGAAGADVAETPDAIRTSYKNVTSSFEDLRAQLQSFQLPIGWSGLKAAFGDSPFTVCSCLFGWLVTAVAVSLGAPFWFDLLNSFMNIRMAGTRPNTDLEKENAGDPATKPTAT